MPSDERTLSRPHLFSVPSMDGCPEITIRSSRPPDEDATLVDLYRPEPTYEVQVVTSPDGLPVVSVRPVSRRESTWSQNIRRRRRPGEETRLAVKGLRRSLRWSAARAWVLAFGLGGSAMAGAVAVLFFAGLLPSYELRSPQERPTPSRPAVTDDQSVLTMREPLVETSPPAAVSAAASSDAVRESASRPPRRRASPRRVGSTTASRTAPNPFIGSIPVSPPTVGTGAPSPTLSISESAGF